MIYRLTKKLNQKQPYSIYVIDKINILDTYCILPHDVNSTMVFNIVLQLVIVSKSLHDR